jgi:hypothetical protein
MLRRSLVGLGIEQELALLEGDPERLPRELGRGAPVFLDDDPGEDPQQHDQDQAQGGDHRGAERDGVSSGPLRQSLAE